jgi:protein-S-isoprenylcysteine O-methyltransferase Ste14
MLLLVVATALHFAFIGLVPTLPSAPALAVAAASLGLLIMLRAWWLFGKVQTAICPTARTTTLITEDVYRLTRNPMYLGIFLMLFGVAILTGGLFHHAAAFAFFTAIDHAFCPYEERKLRQEFPGEFDVYADRVRRWI